MEPDLLFVIAWWITGIGRVLVLYHHQILEQITGKKDLFYTSTGTSETDFNNLNTLK